MNKKTLFWGIHLLFIFLLLVSCKGRHQTKVEPITIRFAIHGYQQTEYESLKQQFEGENPNIRIQFVFTEDLLKQDANSTTITVSTDDDLLLAQTADVFTPIFTRDAAERGMLLDLTPFINADNTFSEDDFYPDLLEQGQWNGRTWTIPYEAIFTLIYFNKDVFDQANIDYPQPGWSWEEFTATAQALTIKENGTVRQWGFLDPQFPSLLWVQGYAGPLFEPNEDPPKAHLDTPETIAAVQWYTDLYLHHEVTAQLPYFDAEALISAGQVAMWPEFISSGEQRRPIMNVGVVPFPVHTPNDHSTPIILVRTYAISAGTAHPDEAWQWLNFISQHPRTWSSLEGPTSLPARRSVTETSNFWQDTEDELETTWKYAIDHAFLPVYGKGFTTAIEAILNDGAAVEAALSSAQNEAEAAIREQLAAASEISITPIIMNEPETVIDESTTVIEFKVYSHQMQAYRSLANHFQASHPDIFINVTAIDLTRDPNLSTLANAADCFQAPPYFGHEVETAVLNLSPLFDADPTISEDDFFPIAIEAFTHQGQLYGLPNEITISTIEFNKDLFDKANIDYPDADWTIDEFHDMAITLTSGKGDEKQYGFAPDVYESSDMLDMIQLHGANLLNDTADPPMVNFNSPATIEAMRWYTNLALEHKARLVFVTTASDSSFADYKERQELIGNGRVAMWTNSNYPRIHEANVDLSQLNIGIAPLPGTPNSLHRGGYQSTTGYFISANTQERQLCWQWIIYLTEQTSIISGLPARRDVAESDAFQQQVGHEKATAYLTTVEDIGQTPFLQNISNENAWLGVSTIWLIAAYDQILNDNVSVEAALDNAQQLANAYRSCVIAQKGYTNLEILQGCLQEVDSTS